jgi:O-antigen/teichoic acid export membrane protein
MIATRQKLRQLGRVLSLSVLNQIVISGMNFGAGLYLVRVLTTAEFGLYGIGFSIMLLYGGVGNAIFITQMVVNVPDKIEQDRLPYASRMLAASSLFCMATLLVACILLPVSVLIFGNLAEYVGYAFSIVAVAIGYLLKNFFVRHAYTAKNELLAFQINATVATSLLTFLLTHHFYFGGLTATYALMFYAASNMAGATAGLILAKLPVLSVRFKRISADMAEAWVGGRWALGGVSVTWLQSQAYVYLSAIFLGPSAVGYANAAKLLVSPALFLLPAVDQVVMPRLAELRNRDRPRMMQLRGRLTAALLAFAIAYSAVILVFGEFVAPLLLGPQYEGLLYLVGAWCIVLVFQFARGGASMVLQIMKEFRILMLTNTFSAALAMIAAIALMQTMGVHGAILGTAIGELTLTLMLYLTIRRKYFTSGAS